MYLIKTPCSEFRAQAYESLRSKWGSAALVFLLFYVILVLVSLIPYAGAVAGLLLELPLLYGVSVFCLRISRGEFPEAASMFDGFKRFGDVFLTLLLEVVYILLWSLLLIIPGIIKSYSYALTPFILKDTNKTNNQAIELSMKMMKGNKMKLFLLDLSFIGWYLLSILTMGIGFIFLAPYMYTARAKFYDALKVGFAEDFPSLEAEVR